MDRLVLRCALLLACFAGAADRSRADDLRVALEGAFTGEVHMWIDDTLLGVSQDEDLAGEPLATTHTLARLGAADWRELVESLGGVYDEWSEPGLNGLWLFVEPAVPAPVPPGFDGETEAGRLVFDSTSVLLALSDDIDSWTPGVSLAHGAMAVFGWLEPSAEELTVGGVDGARDPYRVYGTIDYAGYTSSHSEEGTPVDSVPPANGYNDYGVPTAGDIVPRVPITAIALFDVTSIRVIPEPGAAALLLTGAAAGFGRRRSTLGG